MTVAPSSIDGDANWEPAQQFQFVATDLLLSRQIRADEIYTDDLVVQNVLARDKNGNVTCRIDGSTGEVTIQGNLYSNVSFNKVIEDGGMLTSGAIIVRSGIYYAPEVEPGYAVFVNWTDPLITRVPTYITIESVGDKVRIAPNGDCLSSVPSLTFSSQGKHGSIIGYNKDGTTIWAVFCEDGELISN